MSGERKGEKLPPGGGGGGVSTQRLVQQTAVVS